jgi:putative FmdB family regulatory protein
VPTYQYACTSCEHRFDQVQSFHDDSLTECPECGGTLRKLYGAVGVVFKGSGFYRNDSRSSPSGKDGEKPAAKAEPAGSKEPAGGKEPKPAAATKDSSKGSSSSSKPAPSGSGSTTSGSAA